MDWLNDPIGFFVKTDSDEINYAINPQSPETPEVLAVYEFAGKVVGKAIFERITLDLRFNDCILKAIAGKSPTLKDLQSLDAQVINCCIN